VRAGSFVAGVAALVASVFIVTLPASAADVGRTGPLLIDVVGTFGESRATAAQDKVFPFVGQASLSGLVSASVRWGGTLGIILNTQHFTISAMHGSALDGLQNGTPFPTECTRTKTPGVDADHCTISGAVTGRGVLTRLIVTPVPPVPGGRIEFQIDVPNAFCPRCPPRS
jgi:hypothetical protein